MIERRIAAGQVTRLPAAAKGNDGHSGYERAEKEYYVEPPWAVDALLDRETFRGSIHDPACGGGNIVRTCLARGIAATGADIEDRGCGDVLDFFADGTPRSNIVTNPPFNISVMFTTNALEVVAPGGLVCILQQLTWLEGSARGRGLFDRGKLARVWVFRRRVSMPPGGKAVKAKGGKKAYAWFVFDPDHHGPFVGGWIA